MLLTLDDLRHLYVGPTQAMLSGLFYFFLNNDNLSVFLLILH